MKLKFLGTRGEIESRSRLHRMHSALEVSHGRCSVMIDCGADWLMRIHRMRPDAIVLTHAHPDHAWGLKNGAPCAVYATEDTWRSIRNFPVRDRVSIAPREPFRIGGITLEAFPVEHSIRAPAVGYRITVGQSAVFYAPDLVRIYEAHAALRGIRVYIGDGASLVRPIIRRKGDSLIGHESIRTQLGWCREHGVRKALITHCGSQIVRAEPENASAAVRDLGRDQDVEAAIAYDGLQLALR